MTRCGTRLKSVMRGTSQQRSLQPTAKGSWTYVFPDESKGRNQPSARETNVMRRRELGRKSTVATNTNNGPLPLPDVRNNNTNRCSQKLNKFGRTWDEWVRSLGADRKADSLDSIRLTVESKIQNHKIFTIVGLFGFLRAELHLRGWMERPFAWTYSRSGSDHSEKPESYHEAIAKCKIMDRLTKTKPDFYWNYKRMSNADWKQVSSRQIINRLPMPSFRDAFTSKAGILTCIRNAYWHDEASISKVFSPRSYRMFDMEEIHAFVSDFGITACAGILKWFVHRCDKDGISTLVSNTPRFGLFGLIFALDKLQMYIKIRQHQDLDQNLSLADRQWPQFFKDYLRAISAGDNVKMFQTKDSGEEMYQKCQEILDRLSPYLPQSGIDGHRNMWILKPAESSQGNGIKIFSDIHKILDVCAETRDGHFNWVVQKYIERPLLIDRVKFDIRQWFLVSQWNPLTVWFYKENYLRFCSKQFRFDDFHESIHLCNYAVQVKYTRSETAEVMEGYKPKTWNNATFQQYLKENGRPQLWQTSIYPKMKEAVLSVLLSAKQIYADRGVVEKANAFELFGADFMLTTDFVPWLIEINSLPLISSETKVMRELCGSVLTDCIKVILDRRESSTADTGNFELIYQELPSGEYEVNPEEVQDLVIEGTAWYLPESNGNGNTDTTTAQAQTDEEALASSSNAVSGLSLLVNANSSRLAPTSSPGHSRSKLKYSAKPKYISPKPALKGMHRLDSMIFTYRRTAEVDTSKRYILGQTGMISR